jgi:uncharacterized membrane protein
VLLARSTRATHVLNYQRRRLLSRAAGRFDFAWHAGCTSSVGAKGLRGHHQQVQSSNGVINMKSSESLLRIALPAALALATASSTLAADAGSGKENMEQCAGVIKAGRNDCATKTNACHGHASVDASPEAWIYLPKGSCERIVGARVVNVVDPSPAK